MARRRWGPPGVCGIVGLLEPGLRESDGAAERTWDASVGVWSARLLVVSLLRFRCLTPNAPIALQNGNTALMVAIDKYFVSCVGMLLACGADTTLGDEV